MKKTIVGLLVATVAAIVSAGSASAQGHWGKNHPRQHQVLERTHRQQRRANNLYRQGKITKQQRNNVMRHDRAIRREDHRDARQNGGYITKGQQAAMNHQENNNLGRMNNDASSGQPAAPSTPANGQ